MKKSMKSESELYDLSLQLLGKKSLDISQLSEAEKREVEQNAKLMRLIQTSEKGLSPRKEALKSMLGNLYQETDEEASSDWRSFFQNLFTQKRALAYILPALLIFAGIGLSPEKKLDVLEAQALTDEIQEEFLVLSHDMEELETLTENLLSEDDNTLTF